MPIDSKNPEYTENEKQWKRCHDAYDGEDKVKERGTEYLPKLSGSNQAEYDSYKMRAMFYAATSRTIDGQVGALVKKPPVIKVPAQLEPWLDNVTGEGVGINDFIKQLAAEVMLTNRAIVFVDRPKEADQAPRLILYGALDLLNWKDNKSFFVICEEAEVAGDDKYTSKEVKQYRELELVEGRYVVNLWQENPDAKAKEKFILIDTVVPLLRGVPLDFIPAIPVTSFGTTMKVSQSTIIDMVNVNMSHYRTSADLEHGRHFTALPTPWVSGISGDVPELKIGSQTAWILSDPQARCGFMEFSGAGLAALERGLEQKEQTMAVLGARMLQPTRTGIETAETAQIHQAGEVSALVSIATAIESAIKEALDIVIGWMSLTGAAEVQINREFLLASVTYGDIAPLVQAYQAGTISLDTFLWNLKRGDMIDKGVSVEDEKARIELENEAKQNQANDAMQRQLEARNAQVAQQAARTKIPEKAGGMK